MTPEPWPAHWRCGVTHTPTMRRITRAAAVAGIAAPAKINFGLAVTGKRADGYHKLCTLLATLDLADTVRVAPAPSLSLVCDDPALATDDNLVLRAARALRAATGYEGGAQIALTKRIPVAAGLGGGSSDAATTLLALDALWETRTPARVLRRVARALGADVPFLLYGGAALARGVGDLLWPAVTLPETWLVLVVPRVDIVRKTVALYGALTEAEYDDGRALQAQTRALRERDTLDPAYLGNAFLAPLEQLAPAVATTRSAMEAAGAPAFLSGSGPTLYALCTDEAGARTRAATFAQLPDVSVFVTRTAVCSTEEKRIE